MQIKCNKVKDYCEMAQGHCLFIQLRCRVLRPGCLILKILKIVSTAALFGTEHLSVRVGVAITLSH